MAQPAADRLNPLTLVICWAITAAAFVARAISGAAINPLILDTDDAMRLTRVHDLLGGQGWFDLVQHRLNTPFGAEIHWSRLIDVPEAAIVLLFRPFGADIADIAAAYVWPLGLLLILLWMSGALASRFGGRETAVPALLLPAFCLITMAEFSPGRLDHHGVQIILSFAMLGATMLSLERPRFAIAAGIAAAAALAIGIEGLPLIGATALAFGLSWVVDRRYATAMCAFGLSFALASIGALAIGLAPARWFDPAFDQISIVYIAAAALTGVAFALLSLLPSDSRLVRLGAGVVAGGAVGATILLAWPGLLKGPYGSLDPWLVTHWIDRISEAQPWWVSAVGDPTYPVAVLVPVLVALAVIGWHAVRGEPARRGAWLIYGLFVIVALAVMLLQIRAARVAVPLAIPACAVLIAAARARYLARRRPFEILGLVGAWCVSAGLVVAVMVNIVLLAFPEYAEATTDKTREARQACLMPKAFTSLAALPAAPIMTPIDLGSHVLLYTHHAVVAAPYHRNAQGVRDAFSFFNDPLDKARDILEARGISLLVVCPALPEIRGMVDHADDSFVTLYANDKLPAWLTPLPLEGTTLKAWTVAKR
jgi:hypothetical protein